MTRPVARNAYMALLLDLPLNPAARVDLGIDSERHYAALQNAVQDGLSVEQLDAALGNGQRLTEIAQAYDEGITFTTTWDWMALDEEEDDTESN